MRRYVPTPAQDVLARVMTWTYAALNVSTSKGHIFPIMSEHDHVAWNPTVKNTDVKEFGLIEKERVIRNYS